MRGRRKSASISNTLLPALASDRPIDKQKLVLPSFGMALVTITVLGGLSTFEKWIAVRTVRNASLYADKGLSTT